MPHKSETHRRRPLFKRCTFSKRPFGPGYIPQGYRDYNYTMRMINKANAMRQRLSVGLYAVPTSLNRSKHLDGRPGRYNGHFVSYRDKDAA